MPKKQKFSPKARTSARECSLQALYQWQLTGQLLQDIELQFLSVADESRDMGQADIPYFQQLLHGVPQQINELDKAIVPFLDRNITQLDPVELAILRIGCYELKNCSDVPFRVVINEAVELAKKFGAEKSHKYINGILDKVVKKNSLATNRN
jgi:N utilization substance protein B